MAWAEGSIGRRHRSWLLRLAALASVAALAAPPAVSAPVEVAAHGGLFVGGRPVSLDGLAPRPRVSADPAHAPPLDLNGQYVRGATYVEYTTLARPASDLPILMFPGGGLSAASFQDTPDGRPGWESFFLRHGYSVDLVDSDRTGRSPWHAFPEIDAQEPSFRNEAFLWETFRIGPPGSYSKRLAYKDSRFPLAAFGAFAAQAAPRFRPVEPEQSDSYDSVIRRFCPCIILLHSASGAPGMAAAQRFPELVRAVVAVEPAAAPTTISISPHIPHIFVWGDHLAPGDTDPSWSAEYRQIKAYSERLRAGGASVDWLDLPVLGIRGNSHLLMMDRNSDEVAALIDGALRSALGISDKRRRR